MTLSARKHYLVSIIKNSWQRIDFYEPKSAIFVSDRWKERQWKKFVVDITSFHGLWDNKR